MDKLQNYRNQIDKIDSKLVLLLKKREKIIKEIGLLKKKNNQKISDKKREHEILANMETDFEKETFKTILKESKKIQRRVDDKPRTALTKK